MHHIEIEASEMELPLQPEGYINETHRKGYTETYALKTKLN